MPGDGAAPEMRPGRGQSQGLGLGPAKVDEHLPRLPFMDELFQGGTLGDQLRQVALEDHKGQDGQEVISTAAKGGAERVKPGSSAQQLAVLGDAGAWGCCSTAAFRAGPAQSLPRKWQSGLQSQASHLDRTLRSGAHIAADAGCSWLPQYSSAHSQMTRKVLTEETGGGEEERRAHSSMTGHFRSSS